LGGSVLRNDLGGRRWGIYNHWWCL
jgi:hypothetical protein